MLLFVLQLCASLSLCFGQNEEVKIPNEPKHHTKCCESTGKGVAGQQGEVNVITSPFAAWTVLAVTTEGAVGNTRQQLLSALRFHRLSPRERVMNYYHEIARWLVINMTTAEFTKFNGIFVDRSHWTGLEPTFRQFSQEIYDTDAIDLDFKNSAAATTINRAVFLTTDGWISKVIDEKHLKDTQMIITSATYFKGHWTKPFNVSSTFKQDFFNSIAVKIGEVNMMYNRHQYPFADVRELQATVIELPYGVENHLSMILILPDPGIALQDMFSKCNIECLKTIFQELKVSQEHDVLVDCYIPRFKIDSNIELNEILKKSMGIYDLFDPKKVLLNDLSRWPISGVKVIHKTVIEVTEEGTPNYTTVKYVNDTGVKIFKANRPFCFFIVEKHTHTIFLAGVYQQPILY